MAGTFIKLNFRQLIDAGMPGSFEKNVIYFSYEEYKLKCQAYDPEGRYKTFTALKKADGRANSLHYKCGFAVTGLVETLEKTIPNITDVQERSIGFEAFEFELIETDTSDPALHKVAINYFTAEFKLVNSFADYLLLSKQVRPHGTTGDVEVFFMLKLQPGLSINKYRSEL